ncbi:hypothetical protein SAMN05216321_101534 [Cupriavidus sp. OV038]|jgi:hypothetical protein|uniref:hypothetical protein n=1 Tax=unclassified Cupriavidus TaxID=2640874 RepID=UPI0008E83FDC|nr:MULTISPECIES: hypothetical protein [unclassified Cupriavidus]SFB75661.1 hypothetical protein SAMN05216321_101534 [Cupriavidus sp. OV038]SFO63700.1 hypothetical protein SAMN05216322_101534 [Cupriavidus sp. OV096]
MTTLTIQDLSSTATLDAKKMSAVSGGLGLFAPYTSVYSPFKLSIDKHTEINQQNQQMQSVTSAFGNGSAFQDHMKNTVTTSQTASNNVYGPV